MTPRTQVPHRLAIRARRCEGDAAMARSTASLSMFAALAALLSTSCMATPPEGVPVGMAAPAHVSFATGYKGLSNEWGAADDQWTFGLVDGDWRPPGWPVWLAAQMLFSYDEDAPDAAPFFADWSETYELSLGVRRYGSWGRFEPWIGAGVAWIGASVGDSGSNACWCWSDELEDDAAFGWYADAGVLAPLNPVFHLGLEVRYSDAGSADLFNEDTELGGLGILLLIGSRF